jgi:hypothetical protein
MGCGVFLAGIISLCFYLSGWWNDSWLIYLSISRTHN